MKKKFLSVFMAVMVLFTLTFALSACKDDSDSGSDSDASSDEVIVMKIGSTVSDDSVAGSLLLEFIEPEIEKRSNGRIDVEIYNNSVLGGDRELYEALQLGTLECSCGPLSVLTNFDATFGISDLPFLYENAEIADAALDGEWGAKLAENLPEQGMRVIVYVENGYRNISNSKKPITSLADLSGMKIRVMESPVYLSTWKALGTNPTPIAFSELYTALQNGTVDGQDNGPGLTYTSKVYEVQPYYTVSEQQYAASANVVSEAWWQSLSEEDQAVITEVFEEYRDLQRAKNREMESEYIALMEEYGVQVNYLSDEAKAEFKEACQAVWTEMEATYGEELMALAREVSTKYAK
ncbi:MAG: TRAP transporter substrate-binding protein [Clostridiales Family XIII bacterium]|jgi:tripartite ATP-independent transporter DctP family solute receptor|nr:TRAP transporter substrate-binding protein [Clostridiales Family XIII bacterium]